MHTKLSVFCNKIIEAGWLAAIVAVPLFFNIYTARTFEPDKITLMRTIVSVMVLAWLVKLMEEGGGFDHNQPWGERMKRWFTKPLVIPVVAILVAYIISTLSSISPLVSLWGSYQRLQGTYTFISYMIIFALMASSITSADQIERFITTAIITSVPVSLYGIIQHNGLDPLPWAGDVTARVASNMGNAIFVASYLIMIVPLTASRLVASMKAIITEEKASWGHTVLSAVYIFILAVQILTIIYSQSRGPQIGMLGSFAIMGLLLLLWVRQSAGQPADGLSVKEMGLGLALIPVLGVGTGLLGGLGYFVGRGLDGLLALASVQVEELPLLGAAMGGLIGFMGVYTYLIASARGRRWLWLSWPVLGVLGVVFVLLLNNPEGPLKGLRDVPYLGRLGQITDTEGGTGKVRTLIWEGAINLVKPHRPLGVAGEFTDGLNSLRPLIGYGPESMFNAFAFVYPPELAHIEARGSSADRSHNETMDSLVITGLLGFAAFYLLVGSVFFYTAKWLGWVATRKDSWLLIGAMSLGGLIGGITPYLLQGAFTLSAVGLPFGLFAGLFAFLCWQGLVKLPAPSPEQSTDPLLLIGLIAALVGHFLEVHFVFSIVASYTYFWAYLGLALAIHRIYRLAPQPEPQPETAAPAETLPAAKPQPQQQRRRKQVVKRQVNKETVSVAVNAGGESWETWLGSLGLVMGIIMIILVFDFVPVQFDIATGRYSLLWMSSITFLIGLAMALSDTAAKQERWQTPVNWGRAGLVYSVTSLGYAGLYAFIHSQQRHWLTSGRVSDAVAVAEGISNLLVGFYIILFILLCIIALMLLQRQTGRLAFWQKANWWLYPFLIIATILIIVFKNYNVVKADMFLKEGERYRNAQQWNDAVRLHQSSISFDSDEDFYYLMLALDYQLQAQDGRLSQAEREQAWLQGENKALEARNLNIYNPDNTGNMGRYYFTLGQVFNSTDYYQKAIDFFGKVVELAPQNVQYYNLLAQAHYILGHFDEALKWLNQSVALDSQYVPTWVQLGDTNAAKSDIEAALKAHTQAIMLDPGSFADLNFDSRLNFYNSAGKTADLIAAFQSYVDQTAPGEEATLNQRRLSLWAIGHAYLRSGDQAKAQQFIRQAVNEGFSDAKATAELADIALAQEDYTGAEMLYQQSLQNGGNQAQIYSSLGYIYAKTNRLQEAIDANLKVLESMPNDFDSHKNLALLYQQTGQIEQAISQAQAALASAPEENKADLNNYIAQLQSMLPASPNPN